MANTTSLKLPGGLKEKVLGAHRAGIRHIIIPKANEGDLEDVPEEVRKQLSFHPVETLADVLNVALVRDTRELQDVPDEEEIAVGAS